MLTEKQLETTAYMVAMDMTPQEETKALAKALELIYEIMTNQINDADECEKFLREYAPDLAV